MKSVSKRDEALLCGLHEQVTEAGSEAEAAADRYNEAVQEYNGALMEVAAKVQSYMDDRSDKWHESERGEAYAEWLSALEEEAEESEFCWEETDFCNLPMSIESFI